MSEIEKTGNNAPLQQEAPAVEIHMCNDCYAPRVYPVDWEENGPDLWTMHLRCPDCEICTTGVFTQEESEAFDEELDRGTETVINDLHVLESERVFSTEVLGILATLEAERVVREAEIGAFAIALNQDHILPEDFGRPV